MEGVRGSNPLSSTKFLQIRSGINPSLMVAVPLGEPLRFSQRLSADHLVLELREDED
jgi:hypothetical protein